MGKDRRFRKCCWDHAYLREVRNGAPCCTVLEDQSQLDESLAGARQRQEALGDAKEGCVPTPRKEGTS